MSESVIINRLFTELGNLKKSSMNKLSSAVFHATGDSKVEQRC